MPTLRERFIRFVNQAATDGRVMRVIRKIQRNQLYAFLFALALVLILFPLIGAFASQQAQTSRNELLQQQAKSLRAINQMPPPTDMVPGIVNSQARFVINQTTVQAEALTATVPNIRYGMSDQFFTALSREHRLSKARQINRDNKKLQGDYLPLVNQYADTLQALTNFIEYNPSVDTEEFSLTSSDSQARLTYLQEGLDNATNDIDQTNSAYKNDILSLLAKADVARSSLASTGDVEEFVTAFEQLQEDCIALLDTYHQDIQHTLRQKLTDLSRSLQR